MKAFVVIYVYCSTLYTFLDRKSLYLGNRYLSTFFSPLVFKIIQLFLGCYSFTDIR